MLVRKLHFQANLCKVLPKTKAVRLWGLNFTMSSFAKRVFNH